VEGGKTVEALKIILIVLDLIASVLLVLVIMLQSGKEAGLSALSGKSETFLSKSGGLDKKLTSATKWIALVWLLVTLGLFMVCL
jgi:preprotein translocase subunit SecG